MPIDVINGLIEIETGKPISVTATGKAGTIVDMIVITIATNIDRNVVTEAVDIVTTVITRAAITDLAMIGLTGTATEGTIITRLIEAGSALVLISDTQAMIGIDGHQTPIVFTGPPMGVTNVTAAGRHVNA